MSSIESCPALVGKYHDQLRRASGQLLDFGWRSNIVVDRCRDLLAAFLVGTPAQGIQYIALGRGDSSWDLTPPSPPVAGTTTLVDATPVIAAVTDSTVSLDFVDAVGAVTATPSHRLQLTLTVTGADFPISGDELYPLREFALFGELDGADAMIDYVRHPVMHIAVADSLTRRVRLVF